MVSTVLLLLGFEPVIDPADEKEVEDLSRAEDGEAKAQAEQPSSRSCDRRHYVKCLVSIQILLFKWENLQMKSAQEVR